MLKIPGQIYDAMRNHSEACAPEEACGLLAADRHGALRMVYCLTNNRHSPSEYTIDPLEHFKAMQHAEANGWHLAGAFHSHPAGDAYPSSIDQAQAMEPEWVYVIVGSDRTVRAYRLGGGSVTAVPLEVEV